MPTPDTVITFNGVTKLILSPIETHEIGENKVCNQRALEILTNTGKRVIILEGENLDIMNEHEENKGVI